MAEWKNDGRLKLLIIVGTRPEIIRLAAVIAKCRKYFDTLLAHTGQNWDYTLNGVFFKDLGLADPDIYLDAVGENLGQTMGNIIARSYELMAEMMPEVTVSPPTVTRFARKRLPSGSASDAPAPISRLSRMEENGQATASEASNVPFTTRFVTEGSDGSELVEASMNAAPASTVMDGVPLNRAFSVSASVPTFTLVVPVNVLSW